MSKNSKSVILLRGRSLAIDPTLMKVAEVLLKDGYDVSLLIWDRQNSMEKIKEEYPEYKIFTFNFRAPTDKPTAVFFHPIWWVYIFGFLMKRKYDIIHANDWDTLPPAILAKILKKKPLIYTVYDFYANNLPDEKFNWLRKIIRKIFSLSEKFGIGFTDFLFLVDESRYEEVRGAKIKKVDYIYNSPPDYFTSSNDKIVKKKELTIFYAGLITKLRGIQHMIDAVSKMNGFKLVLAGKVNDPEIIEYASKFPDKASYIGILPTYKDVMEETKKADILFRFSDPNLPKTKYESSNKLFEAMMLAKPFIVSEGSSMAKIVREENCGIVVSYGDVEAIKEALIKLKNDEKLRKQLGKNGRKAYESKYSWKIMGERILKAYKEVAT